MAWRRRAARTSRFCGPHRAARSHPVRRAVVLGGLTLAAWALGSTAPALADTLDLLTEAVQVSAEPTAEITALTETAETALTPVDTVPAPVPPVEPPLHPTQVVDVAPLLDLAETGTRSEPPAELPTGSTETARDSARDTAAPAPAPRPDPAAVPGGDADHGAEPVSGTPAPAAAGTAPDGGSAPEPSVSAAPAPAQSAQAPQQGSASSGSGTIAGYLTHLPAAPRRDALTSTVDPPAAPPTQQHATDAFFSPD